MNKEEIRFRPDKIYIYWNFEEVRRTKGRTKGRKKKRLSSFCRS